MRERRRAGAITGCGKPVPHLTEEEIDSAPRICSQMGPEPFLDAMYANPDFNIIVGGRGYDPSPYVAFAAFASKTPLKDTASPEAQRMWGGFTHMGKIMECGGACSTPKSVGATATVYHDGTFDIESTDPGSRCTPLSVSAHTLYEKTRPDILYGPGGYLDLTHSQYEMLDDDRSCRVRGGTFTFSRDAGSSYQIKLEAARIIGYRAQYMGSIRDRKSTLNAISIFATYGMGNLQLENSYPNQPARHPSQTHKSLRHAATRHRGRYMGS